MALRLAEAFGTSAELWLNMQQSYDIWRVRESVDFSNVERLRGRETQLAH
jgi:antitoxin HigA-1